MSDANSDKYYAEYMPSKLKNNTYLREDGRLDGSIFAPYSTFNGEMLVAWGLYDGVHGTVLYDGTYYFHQELSESHAILLGDQIYSRRDHQVYTIPTDLDRTEIPYQETTLKFLDES